MKNYIFKIALVTSLLGLGLTGLCFADSITVNPSSITLGNATSNTTTLSNIQFNNETTGNPDSVPSQFVTTTVTVSWQTSDQGNPNNRSIRIVPQSANFSNGSFTKPIGDLWVKVPTGTGGQGGGNVWVQCAQNTPIVLASGQSKNSGGTGISVQFAIRSSFNSEVSASGQSFTLSGSANNLKWDVYIP